VIAQALAARDPSALHHVKLVIEREGYGKLEWLQLVDVSGLDLQDIIQIDRGGRRGAGKGVVVVLEVAMVVGVRACCGYGGVDRADSGSVGALLCLLLTAIWTCRTSSRPTQVGKGCREGGGAGGGDGGGGWGCAADVMLLNVQTVGQWAPCYVFC
jgi:hypothetical protein